MTHGKCAEPGVLFWDTIRRESLADCYADYGFETVSTNPVERFPYARMTVAVCWL